MHAQQRRGAVRWPNFLLNAVAPARKEERQAITMSRISNNPALTPHLDRQCEPLGAVHFVLSTYCARAITLHGTARSTLRHRHCRRTGLERLQILSLPRGENIEHCFVRRSFCPGSQEDHAAINTMHVTWIVADSSGCSCTVATKELFLRRTVPHAVLRNCRRTLPEISYGLRPC